MADDWGFYERRTDSERLRVLVNVGYKQDAPLEEHSELLTITINLYAVLRDNKTKKAVIRQLEHTEALLERWLSSTFKAIYVGRINSMNRLEYFYYLPAGIYEGQSLREWLRKSWTFRIAEYVKSDPEWSMYHELLPDKLEQLYVHNAQMIYALLHKGDNIKQPRAVYHWLMLRQQEDKTELEAALQKLGYQIEREKEGESDDTYPYPLVISRYDNVMLETINGHVRELYRLLSSYEGRYDGWGSAMKLSAGGRVRSKVRRWLQLCKQFIRRFLPFGR